ncbi:MAG: Ppx/GppA family phosphatase [Erythrobacter sp.]|jgi:exopolyphosphatase/guanosine-5'-triphosphate,3'-diphosphate pyrophosphatase|nr:Ppx/GppA family phosphatase [Erythrobacter sp.]
MHFKRRREDRDGAFSGTRPNRAIIDIGSNTVRLVIYGGSPRAPAVLLNEKVTARLGRDIGSKGALAEEAIDLALRALARFVLLLEDLGIADVETVATAAVREARNGPDFIASLKELGLAPRVLSGEEEAVLGASGVAGAFRDACGVVADLGGGSLELVDLANEQAASPVSLPLGALRLPDFRAKGDKSDNAMRDRIERVIREQGGKRAKGQTLYLVGGTWRAMAVFAMQLEGNPLSDPHGFAMEPEAADKAIQALARESFDTLKARKRISTMRAEKLPDAAILLSAMLKVLEPRGLVFSAWGLREGLLYERLGPEDRAQDPLLAGIAVFAGQRGAPATLAAQMAGWTAGAVPARIGGGERLRLAATMLALASMQIEPNLRLPQAVDWALHKRWIGIEAHERAMLGAAISANGNELDLPASIHALASEEALAEAIGWGLAVRLARRLGGRSRRSLQVSRLLRIEDMLTLRLARSHEALYGVPVEKDMKLLAGHLGCAFRVEIVADDALYGSD